MASVGCNLKLNIMTINQLVTEIINSTMNNGGTTINVIGSEPTQRYCFALLGSEMYVDIDNDTHVNICEFISANDALLSRSGAFVGTWLNEGKICLDVSRTTDSFEDAVYWGIMNRQQAIYDRLTNTVINVPAGQFMHRDYQNQSANRQLAQNFVERYNTNNHE